MTNNTQARPYETLSLSSTVAARSELLSCEVDREAIILDGQSGTYFGLNPVGSRIWTLLQEPRTLSDVRDALTREFEVSAAACENELVSFVRDLAEKGLVEIRP